MSLAPRTHVQVVYEGVDITKDISKDLLSLSYTDNEGGKADDISLTLKNNHGLWSDAWLPSKGDSITTTIIKENDEGVSTLSCGSCEIDEIELSGPPSVIEIKGVSVPLSSTIRRTKKSRAWENVRLSEICTDVANTGGVELVFQPNPANADFENKDPLYERRDQRDETDLLFLKRICEDEALSLKLTDQQLVVYDQNIMQAQSPVVNFSLGEDWILNYKFNTQASEVFKTAIVQYNDPKSGSLNKFVYEDASVEKGQTLKIVRRTESVEEAERVAKAALKKINRQETTAILTVVGRVDLVSGITVNLFGFGKFSGKYYVEKSEHTVQNGYTVSLEMTFVEAV